MKGLWRLGPKSGEGQYVMHEKDVIAHVFNSPCADNGALIAAAPDLLKACEDVLSTIEGGDSDDAFIAAMQAAVKKAKGIK